MRLEASLSIGASDRWQALNQAAATAALVVILFIAVQIAVYAIWPPPSEASEWFALFQDNPLVGLLTMDTLLSIDYALLAIVYVALLVALWRESPSLAVLGALFSLLGVAAYFASTAALNMMSLSQQFAATTTDAARVEILAAGRAMIALWTGNAFTAGYLMSATGAILFAAAMLRTNVFSRSTGYVGLIMGLTMLIPPTFGSVGVMASLLSLFPTVIWLGLVARDLFGLARSEI